MSANNGCAADFLGVCARRRFGVACTYEYDPVCGCDGRTYGNACALENAKVGFNHDGECRGGTSR